MQNLSWLIFMEVSYQRWLVAFPKGSRLQFYNMLYGPHVGDH